MIITFRIRQEFAGLSLSWRLLLVTFFDLTMQYYQKYRIYFVVKSDWPTFAQ